MMCAYLIRYNNPPRFKGVIPSAGFLDPYSFIEKQFNACASALPPGVFPLPERSAH